MTSGLGVFVVEITILRRYYLALFASQDQRRSRRRFSLVPKFSTWIILLRIMSGTRSYWLALRLIVYIGLQAGALAIYAYVTIKVGYGEMEGIDLARLLREDQILEWLELGLIGMAILLSLGALRKGQPPLHRMLLAMLFIPLFREMDDLIESISWKDAHHILIGAAMLTVIVLAVRNRQHLRQVLPGFMNRPGFYFMLFGVMLVVFYGQILGQRDIWKILSPEISRLAKRFIEEGMEMMGYICVIFGMIEERFFSGMSTGLLESVHARDRDS